MKVKLLDSLDAVKQGTNVVTGFQEEFELRPSSLLALAEFPRLRLLWASFQWLRKQAITCALLYSFLLIKEIICCNDIVILHIML